MRLFNLTLLLTLTLTACRTQPTPTPPPSPTPSAAEHLLYLPSVESSLPPSLKPTPHSPLPTPQYPIPNTQYPPTPTPLPPPVFKPGWGIQLHLFGVDLEQALDWAQGLGVQWVKQQVEWTNIEHAPGQYEWGELDRIVDQVNGYGFRLLLSLNHAPEWTRAEPLESGPPRDPAEFGRFMGLLAARYQGRVAAYELWNEPNLRREWRGENLDPALFVALVREGAQAVRASDPAALVVSGAPAVTGINDGQTAVDDRVYLRGMVAAGVGQWVDGVGVHPYGFANPPQERWDDPAHQSPSHNEHPSFFFRDTLDDYRAILNEGGLGALPLWATEFGWPSVEGLGEVDTSGWEYARHVSEAQQAAYTVQAFQASRADEGLGPMILWNLNIATIWGAERPESAYSLLRPDGSYRPAYIAVRVAEPLRP
jgi:hypothetical protein